MTASEADHVARELAAQAYARIEGHEKVCAERQINIINSLTAVQRGVDRLNGRFWTAAIMTIVLLLSACGGLITIVLRSQH